MGILQIFFLNTIELFAQYGLFKVALVHFAFTSESWVLTLLVRRSFSHFDSIWVWFWVGLDIVRYTSGTFLHTSEARKRLR